MLDSSGYRGVAQRAELRAIAGSLAALRSPTEPVFLALGKVLAEALGMLEHLGADFATLALSLQAEQATSASAALRGGVEAAAALAAKAAEATTLLRRLGGNAAAGVRPLATLTKVVAEVHALAINARIEAAQVQANGIDFTVFTTEIARLGRLAGDAVGKAADRLARLGPAITHAIAAEEAFDSTDGRELDAVRGRLQTSLEELARRRRQAGEAAAVVARKAGRITARIAACVVALQINDLTSQRIEHVCDAIGLLDTILDEQDLDGGRGEALVASVCRLQAHQLTTAADDFGREIGCLKANMKDLAGDAEEVLAEAAAMIGGNGSATSFVGDLRDNVERAAALLSAYGVAEARVQALIGTVSEGFAAMEGDLVAIHSIDTDMRIMGLNASLKCARLGSAGRSLGVVAQELRGCSRRTEETIRAVSGSISAAVAAASTLSDCSRHEDSDAGALVATMGASMEALCGLGDSIEAAVTRLGDACRRASRLLAETAAGIAIDAELPAASAAVAARLSAIADSVEVDPRLTKAIRDDVLRLLEGRYTMASERMVHDLFAEGGGAPPQIAAAGAGEGSDDVDDCFL